MFMKYDDSLFITEIKKRNSTKFENILSFIYVLFKNSKIKHFAYQNLDHGDFVTYV